MNNPQDIINRYQQEKRPRSWFKWLLIIIVASIILITAFWMSNVSNTLHDIKDGVQQNTQVLADQKLLLTQMNEKLNAVWSQLLSFEQEVRSYFIQLVNMINHLQ